jgi:hypothetical protein
MLLWVYSWAQYTQSRRRQHGEFGQRFLHLRRRAFEQPAATGSEQRVAAEERAVVIDDLGHNRRCGRGYVRARQ